MAEVVGYGPKPWTEMLMDYDIYKNPGQPAHYVTWKT